jgi:hypothetical protein
LGIEVFHLGHTLPNVERLLVAIDSPPQLLLNAPIEVAAEEKELTAFIVRFSV